MGGEGLEGAEEVLRTGGSSGGGEACVAGDME